MHPVLFYGIVFFLFVLALLYLGAHFRRIEFIRLIANDNIVLARKIAFVILLLICIILGIFFDVQDIMACVFHFAVILFICNAIMLFLAKTTKIKVNYSASVIIAMVITVIYLTVGWHLAHHIFATQYQIKADKKVSPLRIVQLSDSHIGRIFSAKEFSECLAEVQAQNPDIVVLTGDYVDEKTTLEDLVASTKALGSLNTKYGIYFCYGNNDKDYDKPSDREWTVSDLENVLSANCIHILEDESVPIGDDYYLIGRKDKLANNRLTMSKLLDNVDREKFTIVLDHHPTDFSSQEAESVDLVLSSHTHGGGFFPINRAGEWVGASDMVYGYTKRGNTNFIVSSGLSTAGAFQFKTGCYSEYVVIDIE